MKRGLYVSRDGYETMTEMRAGIPMKRERTASRDANETSQSCEPLIV